MNLKNHCNDVGKALMPHEEFDGDSEYSDLASQSEESDIEDDEAFVPVAQDILDLMQEAEDDEAQSTESSELDLDI